MFIKQVLDTKGHDVVTVEPDRPIWAVLRSFRRHGIGALVVVDDGNVVGLLGERDIVGGLITSGKRALDMTVREVMTTAVPTCTSSTSIASAMMTMTNRRTRHLPVVDDGELVGIISIGDVVKARLDDAALENQVLREMVRTHGSS